MNTLYMCVYIYIYIYNYSVYPVNRRLLLITAEDPFTLETHSHVKLLPRALMVSSTACYVACSMHATILYVLIFIQNIWDSAYGPFLIVVAYQYLSHQMDLCPQGPDSETTPGA